MDDNINEQCDVGTYLNSIPKLVSDQLNDFFMKKISLEEVKKAIFSMDGDKALELNGFLSFFFQHFWEILKMDLWEMVEEER